MATTIAKMIITPIALNPDHLSSSTTMVRTRMMLPVAHVSSISFCRPRAATTSYVSLKAWSSRCSPWRTITKSASCEIHQPTDDDSQNDQKGSHFECSESPPLMENMYQLFQTEKKLYQNLLKSAHHWDRYKTLKKIYHYYKKAVYKSRHPDKHRIVTSNSAVASALFSLFQKYPYKIPMHIQNAIRAPFDYCEFGRKYFRPLIDFKNSYVGNIFIFQEIEEKIQKGENVILFSNHQHGADHVISGLLLESTHPFISENVTYLVEEGFSDPFYNIFNMGRNIINGHYTTDMSKYDAQTQLMDDQIRQLLRSGSQIIWYSACDLGSKYPVTQQYIPVVDRNSEVGWVITLACESNVPFHIYPLGLYYVPPPPFQFPKSRRRHASDWYEQVISFHGVGLSIGHEFPSSFKHFVNDNIATGTTLHLNSVHGSIMCHYRVLQSALRAKEGLAASDHMVSLSQPSDFLS